MENGPKILIGMTVVVVLAFGARVAWQHKVEQDDARAAAVKAAGPVVDPDDNVYLKRENPDSLADERALIGTTLWVSAGGQLNYYRDTGRHVDYAHPVGLLASNQPMLIKEVFEQVAPHTASAVFRIPAGKRHVLLGFTMPGSADPKALYATPVGNFDDGYNLYNDNIFFYEDPHKLYDYWGAAMWSHIDKHEVVPSMSERQAMMAVGQVQTPGKGTYGNRSIVYDNSGHPITVDFENDKAVHVTPGG